MISTQPLGGDEEYPQQTGGTQRVCIKNNILQRPVQKQHIHSASGLNRADLTVVFTMKFWRAKPSERLNAVLLSSEIFLSTEQTLQVTNIFNGVYYFIIASCYNRQLKHNKQKKQKSDVLEDQISFPYICFVNLHSSTFCFFWWAVIKA